MMLEKQWQQLLQWKLPSYGQQQRPPQLQLAQEGHYC
jgi:hypothetical protein